MTAYANTFEGGSNGTTITAANSGGTSGDAWDVVTSPIADATLKYDNTHAAHGSLSAKIATVTTTTLRLTKNFASATTTPALRVYVYFTANPALNTILAQFRSSTTRRLEIQITTGGKVRLVDAANAAQFTSTNSITLNAWVRIEVYSVTLDPTTGAATVAFFNTADSATATESISVSSKNFGGSADNTSYGIGNAQANAGPFWLDDVAENNTGTAIGPAVTATDNRRGGFLPFFAAA